VLDDRRNEGVVAVITAENRSFSRQKLYAFDWDRLQDVEQFEASPEGRVVFPGVDRASNAERRGRCRAPPAQ
jgi:hypothetical protein